VELSLSLIILILSKKLHRSGVHVQRMSEIKKVLLENLIGHVIWFMLLRVVLINVIINVARTVLPLMYIMSSIHYIAYTWNVQLPNKRGYVLSTKTRLENSWNFLLHAPNHLCCMKKSLGVVNKWYVLSPVL